LKNKNWKKYTFEFLSIFIAVVSAFALNNWNENRNNQNSDTIFKDLLNGKEVSQDSIGLYYTALFRDYIPIINKSAYESLKANNLKTVTNDSLRLQIIELYDYYYSIIEALEYSVPEMQSFDNYFSEVNKMLTPYMEFDKETGNLIAVKHPYKLSEIEDVVH